MKKQFLSILLSVISIASVAQSTPTLNYTNGVITGTATRTFTVASAISNETPIVTNFSSPVYVKAVVSNMINFRLTGGTINITQPGMLTPNGYQNYRFVSGNGRVYSLDFGGLVDAYQTAPQGSRPSFPNMGNPFGVANVGAGDLVSDPLTHRIYLITSAATPMVVAGNPTTVQSGDQAGSSSSYALMHTPMSILPIPGQRNKVWVADKGNNKIKILNVETQTTTDQVVNGVTLNAPVGLATDPTGAFLYVTDANRLIKIDLSNNNATVIAGATTAGDVDGGLGTSRLNNPMGITVDRDGNVFIADKLNHKIKIYVPSVGDVVTIAGNGTPGDVLGQDQAAQFNQPVSLLYDYGANTIQVSDYGNNKVKTLTFTTAYNINPAVPAGLSFNKFTGVISGTPTLYTPLRNYTVTLDNGTGTAQIVLPIQVLDIPPANLNYSSSANIFTVGTAITSILPSNSGGVIASYSVYPALPPGLSMSATTGIISGTPTEGTVQTDYVITGVNTGGTISSTVSIYVQGPPYNMGYSRAQAVLVQNEPAYLMALPMSYPAATSYSMHAGSPTLPAGLSLNTTTGEITGTPTTISASTVYTIDVTNAFGTASGTVEIQVQAKPIISYVQPSAPYIQGNTITPLMPSLGGGSINANLGGWTGNTGLQFGGNIAFIQYGNGPTRWVLDAGHSLFKWQGGSGSPASLPGGTPTYLIMDPQYFFYNVSNDVGNTRISKSPASNTSRLVKQWGAGTIGYLDGPSHLAKFNNMGQIATDAIGSRIYIPDRGNNRIRFLNVITNQVTTIAGSGSVGTSNGIGAAASFTDPVAVTLGSDDNLYILDQISSGVAKIRKLNLTTYEVTDFVSLNFTPSNYLVTDKGGDMYLTGGDVSGLRRITRDGLVLVLPNNEPLKSLVISPENGDVIIGPVMGAPMSSSFTNKGYFFTPGESITITPALFAGLNFDLTNGTITGTPTGAGLTPSNNTQTYTVRATNRAGIFSTNVTLTVVRPPSGLTYQYAPWNILVGSTTAANTINNATLAVGGLPVETYTVSPTLPAGLSLNPTTGQITGSALNLQASTAYTITASNAHGSTTATLYISVEDKPRPAYVGPQIYLKNNAITSLVPTNTGGAVLSPAEIRLSNLATLSNNNNDVFDILDITKDDLGNIFVGIAVNSGQSYLINKYDPNGNELKSQIVTIQPYRLAYYNNAIYFLSNYYYGQYMHKMDVSSTTWTPIATSLEHPGYQLQEYVSKMKIRNNVIYISNRFRGLLTYNLSTLQPENLFLDPENGNVPTNIWKGIWDNINGEHYDQNNNIVQGGYTLNFDGDFDFNQTGDLVLYGNITHNPLTTNNQISSGVQLFHYDGAALNFVHQSSINSNYNINQPRDIIFHSDGSVIVADEAGFYKTDNNSLVPYAGDFDIANGRFNNAIQVGTIPMSQGQAGPISFNDLKRVIADTDGNLITIDGTSGNWQNPPNHNLIQKYEERVAYRISPSLPTGLTIDAQTGAISGTATVVSPSTNYTITAYNSVGSRSTNLNLTVGAALDFSYQYEGQPYGRRNNTNLITWPFNSANATFSNLSVNNTNVLWEITNGTDIYNSISIPQNSTSFTISPSLPTGMVLNSASGIITGIPTVSRNSTTYTITATNAFASSSTQITFAVTGPSNISYVNQSYIQGNAGSANPSIGGVTNPSYTVTSGALPTGVTLNSSTGVLTYDGVGAAASSSSVTITATGSAGTASATFTIAILAPGNAPSNLSYGSSITLATGSAITPINPSINTGTAGSGGVTYSISPSLTALTGLTFNTSTGVISGTPTALLSTTFTVTATTAYGSTSTSFSLQVGAVPSALSYPNASYRFWRGDAISNITPTITNGTGATTFSAAGLPAGLTIDPISGTIYGIPSTAQAAGTATITASNTYGAAIYTISFTIIAPPTISYNAANSYTTSQANIALTPSISGGYNNSISIVGNIAATGLALNSGTGVLAGTASSSALATTVYTATISSTVNGVNKTATSIFNITIGAAPSSLSYTTPQVIALNNRIANLTPTITNGTGVVYTATGLPAGLNIDPNTGIIYGTATSNQSATNATVTATNVYGSTQATISFAVGEAPSNLVFTPAINYILVNAMSVNIPSTVNQGSGGVTYSISPSLPTGFSLDPNTGIVSGATSLITSANYIVTASNLYGSTNSIIQLATNNGPNFGYVRNHVYSAGSQIADLIPTIYYGAGSTQFSVSPSLPAGLSIDPLTGYVTGTPTAGIAVPMASYSVTGTNLFGTSNARLDIEIQGPPTNLNYGANIVQPINVALPAAIVPTVVASPAVATYSVTPALPAGLTFDPITGIISGTPTVAQQATVYTFSADNWIAPAATYSLTITVSASPVISYSTPQTFVTGNAITALTPSVQNSVTSWSISPALPTGLIFNTSTGVISGSPSAASTAGVYTITATNSFGSGTAQLTITVHTAPSGLSYTLTNSHFSTGIVISAISPAINAGTGTLTYTVSPNLPTGLTINSTTGVISGTPTVAVASINYTITATSAYGNTSTTIQFATGVAPSSLVYNSSNILTAGTAMTALTPSISAGTGTITYTVSPNLPAGLTLNSITGVISGTPTASVSVPVGTFTVTATNAFGATSTTLQIGVQGPPTNLTYPSNSLSFTINTLVTIVVPSVLAYPAPIYTVSPALPAGLTLNTLTGAISGTPTTGQASSTYTITASNGYSPNATTVIHISIASAPIISYSSAYVFSKNNIITPIVPGVINQVDTWTINPSLSAGLTFDTTNGNIIGTPTSVLNATTYTVTATNVYGSSDANFTIEVQGAPTNLTYSNASFSLPINTAITTILPTINANPTPTYSISPALPTGLLFNTINGAISGTPTIAQASGTYTITANNGLIPNATISISISITASPIISYSSNYVFKKDSVISTIQPTFINNVDSWKIIPALPTGLIFDTLTGEISGKPISILIAANYIVIAKNTHGSDTASFVIDVNGPPTLTLNNNNTTIVGLQPIQIAAPVLNSNPAPVFSISPNLPTGLSINPSTGAITGTPTNYSAAITYTIHASNSIGTTSIPLVLAILPQVSTINSNSNKLCGITPLQLSNTTANGVWSSLQPSIAKVSSAGLVTGIGSADASVVIAYTITVQGVSNTAYDTISYIASPALPTRLPTVDLISMEPTVLQARPIAVQYSWSPSNWLSNASVSNPTVIANQEIEFKIEMIASNGCKTVDTLTARMFDRADVFLPNMFTPNGDGVNDLFKINPVGMKSLNYFRVFNQWGKMIFQTNRIAEGWDGYYDNQLQPLASYSWLLEAIDNKGNLIHKAGTVTLIR